VLPLASSGTPLVTGGYPLTDPAVRPRTKKRCRETNTSTGTIMLMMAPAVSSCQPCCCAPDQPGHGYGDDLALARAEVA
jgi:hypothetical protein